MTWISKVPKWVFFISDHPETIQEVKIKQPKQQQATEIHADKLSRECLKHTLLPGPPLTEKQVSGGQYFKALASVLFFCPSP